MIRDLATAALAAILLSWIALLSIEMAAERRRIDDLEIHARSRPAVERSK